MKPVTETQYIGIFYRQSFFDILPDAEMMKRYQKALAMNKNASIIIVPSKAQLEGQHHHRWRQGQKESCWISLSKQ